jgi:hypothetical protein
MRDYLASLSYAAEVDEFDTESAIYWFACHWHAGQSSNLYSALSTSEYSPGPMRDGPDEGMAEILYDELVAEYAPDDVRE